MRKLHAWKFIRSDMALCHDTTKSWKRGQTHSIPEGTPLSTCFTGFHASTKALDALEYASIERTRLTLVEYSTEHLTANDKLCARSMKVIACASEKDTQRELRLFACRCARQALKLVKKPDPRSINAVTVSERFARGKATRAELTAAWDAARDAARDAAWDAARDAAWDAARDAARDAAWDAAWDAARGAAWGAARGAAWGAVRKKQEADLTKTFKKLIKRASR